MVKKDQRPKNTTTFLSICVAMSLIPMLGNPQKGATQAQKSSAGAKPVRIVGPYVSREDMDEYTKVVLKNGLSVILFERRDMPLVSILTYVKAGSLNESDETRGVSQLLEHMLFNTTSKREAGRIVRETKRLGGCLNVGTSYDYTYYSTVLPAENVKAGLEIQADALQDPAFLEGEIQRELPIISQEARRRLENPETFSLERLYELAFEGSPLGSLLRAESSLSPLSRKQLTDFYRKWYVPSNIVLVITGNLDRRAVLDEVVKRYANMSASGRVNSTISAEQPRMGLRYREIRGDISESLVQLGFVVPAAFTRDWYACKVLEAALTAGRTAILNRNLKEELRLVSSVSSSFLKMKNQGYLAFAFTTNPGKIDRAEAAAVAQLERIRSGFLGEEDVGRAKTLLERDFYLDQEKLEDLALQLADSEKFVRYSEWREFVKKVRTVEREQVIQVAQKYLSLPSCSVIEYQPGTAPPRSFTAQTFADSLNRSLPAAIEVAQQTQGLEGILELPKPVVGRTIRGREPAQREISPASPDYPLVEYSILRGPNVLVKESHALPLISLGLFFPGGRIFESTQNNGITELMVRSSVKGSQRLNALRITSILENYGVKIDLRIEPDFFGYVLTGLSQNIAEVFETFWDVVKNPQFAEEEIERERNFLLADIARTREKNVILAQRLFLESLYGKHAYGLPPLGSRDSVAKLASPDVNRWHERFVKRAVPLIVIAGDTEGSAFAARFANQLSISGASFVDLKRAMPVRRLEAPSIKVEIRNRQQTASVIGFLGPPADSPFNESLVIIENLLSGSGGRFFEELWDKRRMAHTVTAAQTERLLDGSFSAYVATPPESEQAALDYMKQEFKRLTITPVSDEELTRAKNYSAGIYRIRLQQRAEQVYEFAKDSILGKSLDEIKRYPQNFLDVDQGMIKEAATKYFDLDRVAEGIVRASPQ